VESRLQALSNVVMTPHIGSADGPTRRAMADMAVDAVIAVLEGREAGHRVV